MARNKVKKNRLRDFVLTKNTRRKEIDDFLNSIVDQMIEDGEIRELTDLTTGKTYLELIRQPSKKS